MSHVQCSPTPTAQGRFFSPVCARPNKMNPLALCTPTLKTRKRSEAKLTAMLIPNRSKSIYSVNINDIKRLALLLTREQYDGKLNLVDPYGCLSSRNTNSFLFRSKRLVLKDVR